MSIDVILLLNPYLTECWLRIVRYWHATGQCHCGNNFGKKGPLHASAFASSHANFNKNKDAAVTHGHVTFHHRNWVRQPTTLNSDFWLHFYRLLSFLFKFMTVAVVFLPENSKMFNISDLYTDKCWPKQPNIRISTLENQNDIKFWTTKPKCWP